MLQAVFSIPSDKRDCLKKLYPDPPALIRACLEGRGEAYGDHPFMPGAALLIMGAFAFPGGDPARPGARRLMGKLALQRGRAWLVPQTAGWEKHLRYWKPAAMEQAVGQDQGAPGPLWEVTY